MPRGHLLPDGEKGQIFFLYHQPMLLRDISEKLERSAQDVRLFLKDHNRNVCAHARVTAQKMNVRQEKAMIRKETTGSYLALNATNGRNVSVKPTKYNKLEGKLLILRKKNRNPCL